MPQILEYIDHIAIEKQSTVLFLIFTPPQENLSTLERINWIYWEKHPSRIKVTQWLNANSIKWRPCAGYSNSGQLEGYDGTIFIDTPYDNSCKEYRKLENYLENPDGTLKLPYMKFGYLPLDMAIEISSTASR